MSGKGGRCGKGSQYVNTRRCKCGTNGIFFCISVCVGVCAMFVLPCVLEGFGRTQDFLEQKSAITLMVAFDLKETQIDYTSTGVSSCLQKHKTQNVLKSNQNERFFFSGRDETDIIPC